MKDRYTYVPLLEFVNNLTQLYVPELNIGYSPSCCSDHQSFFEQGYPAVGYATLPLPSFLPPRLRVSLPSSSSYFENTGSASDYPNYHKSTDTPQWLNFKQVSLISRAIGSAAATIAVPME